MRIGLRAVSYPVIVPSPESTLIVSTRACEIARASSRSKPPDCCLLPRNLRRQTVAVYPVNRVAFRSCRMLVFTPRGGDVHVISLRKANRREIKRYEEEKEIPRE
ncbi:MAG: hypothetical protein JWO52_1236 [Gammaproteobacteria bacterium]|nr:hypothetical protein [Gammaproteobacteria bacterium]